MPAATAPTPSTSSGATSGAVSASVGVSATGAGYLCRRRRLTVVDPRTRRLVTLGVLALSIALVVVAAVVNR